MITRVEYNNALDVVEAYHKQIFGDAIGKHLRSVGSTPIIEWNKLNQCSTRLRNVLNQIYKYRNCKNDDYDGFVETIDFNSFIIIRNSGKKTWDEFVSLRGY